MKISTFIGKQKKAWNAFPTHENSKKRMSWVLFQNTHAAEVTCATDGTKPAMNNPCHCHCHCLEFELSSSSLSLSRAISIPSSRPPTTFPSSSSDLYQPLCRTKYYYQWQKNEKGHNNQESTRNLPMHDKHRPDSKLAQLYLLACHSPHRALPPRSLCSVTSLSPTSSVGRSTDSQIDSQIAMPVL